jgi:hypothetical protein
MKFDAAYAAWISRDRQLVAQSSISCVFGLVADSERSAPLRPSGDQPLRLLRRRTTESREPVDVRSQSRSNPRDRPPRAEHNPDSNPLTMLAASSNL